MAEEIKIEDSDIQKIIEQTRINLPDNIIKRILYSWEGIRIAKDTKTRLNQQKERLRKQAQEVFAMLDEEE